MTKNALLQHTVALETKLVNEGTLQFTSKILACPLLRVNNLHQNSDQSHVTAVFKTTSKRLIISFSTSSKTTIITTFLRTTEFRNVVGLTHMLAKIRLA